MNVPVTGFSAVQPNQPIESNAAAQGAVPAQTKLSASDSVKLSQAAQVHLMKEQGQSASQIQSSLGITAAVLDGYLGISVPKAAAASLTSPGVVTPGAHSAGVVSSSGAASTSAAPSTSAVRK